MDNFLNRNKITIDPKKSNNHPVSEKNLCHSHSQETLLLTDQLFRPHCTEIETLINRLSTHTLGCFHTYKPTAAANHSYLDATELNIEM